ncbi:class I SAM-dependent methyltransferase [Tropicimonas sp. S265A]|uniref:class I SAM-dependent methyltransferase n=1 Tax=Tropicimonas sp. S265A TaxID=3415134 RepID=UPI003C7C955A
MYVFDGQCPVCQKSTTYRSKTDWFRDGLLCDHCKSIPRERAFAWCLNTFAPNWRAVKLHESSPVDRSISGIMMRQAEGYVGTHFYPEAALGEMHNGFRCENLECMTFADESFDLHCHLDVLEHVNEPELCFREMERTLKPGGMMIFTTPVYEGKLKTERRARYTDTGVEHLAEPEYHGNPINDEGALVTFHYGSDFAELIQGWAPGCGVNMVTLNDPRLGVIGKFREVFVVTKYGRNDALAAQPVEQRSKLKRIFAKGT